MRRQVPITTGSWARVARKHYRHESGVDVIYRHDLWAWEIVGGNRRDGLFFKTLSAAQHAATYRKVTS